MTRIRLALLRGVCQTPAYVAHARGFFADEGLDVEVKVSPTAWLVPEELLNGKSHFGVIPWTRVAAAERDEAPLKVICGSGHEEAALVVRRGLDPAEVKSVAVPREGGIKDLTAMGLIDSMGWGAARQLRFPSGDGAILAFVGQGVDAASMVEPYATMCEVLGLGTVVRRTGDLWRGAPGCSLTASAELIARDPELVQKVVTAYVRGARAVHADPSAAAAAAEPYIGVSQAIILKALGQNGPHIDALASHDAMEAILALMQRLGYVAGHPHGFADLRFLAEAKRRLEHGA
ncbi:MAG: ABC transporter substrate-binding protein [Myxococcota bacterium]